MGRGLIDLVVKYSAFSRLTGLCLPPAGRSHFDSSSLFISFLSLRGKQVLSLLRALTEHRP